MLKIKGDLLDAFYAADKVEMTVENLTTNYVEVYNNAKWCYIL